MGTQLSARTAWEVEAARRREVIEDAVAARRILRPTDAQAVDRADGASRGPLSAVRGLFNAPAEPVDGVR